MEDLGLLSSLYFLQPGEFLNGTGDVYLSVCNKATEHSQNHLTVRVVNPTRMAWPQPVYCRQGLESLFAGYPDMVPE
jgi:hypothetical protein